MVTFFFFFLTEVTSPKFLSQHREIFCFYRKERRSASPMMEILNLVQFSSKTFSFLENTEAFESFEGKGKFIETVNEM